MARTPSARPTSCPMTTPPSAGERTSVARQSRVRSAIARPSVSACCGCCSTSAHWRYPALCNPDVRRKCPSSSAPDRRNRSRSSSRVIVLEVLVEQLQDPVVLVGPAGLFLETVVLDRERRERPVLLSQLDQPLDQTHAVLEEHVGIDHAVANQ